MKRLSLAVAFLLLASLEAHAQCTYSVTPIPSSLQFGSIGWSPNPVVTATVTATDACFWRIAALSFVRVDVDAATSNGTYGGTRTIKIYNFNPNYAGASRAEDVVLIRTDTETPFATIHVRQRGRSNEVFPGGYDPGLFMRRSDGQEFTRIMNVRGGCATCYSPQAESAPVTGGGEPGDAAIVRAELAEFVRPFNGESQWNLQSLYRDPRNGQNFVLYHPCSSCGLVRIDLPPLPNPDYVVAGLGYLNGDNYPDLVWRNPTTGATAVWLMGAVTENRQANTASIAFLGVVNLPWLPSNFVLSGVDDFDGDGSDDILWHNTTNGNNALWMMNGTTLASIVNLPVIPNLAYKPVAVGAYDEDGWPDIVWRNTSDGRTAVWKMQGTSFSGQVFNTFTENDSTLWDALVGPK